MLDINPDGNLCIIFPNYFHPSSFIRAGEITQIPPQNKFKLKVSGPSGLERIKAFVTLNKVSLLQMNLSKRQPFQCIKKKTMHGNKTVEALSKKVDSIDSSGWSEAYTEIFIFKEGVLYKRGLRKIKKNIKQ